MTLAKPKTLMVMAGGTGGHVYPAMAVADYLKQQGWKIVWLCTQGGMENRLIENKAYEKAMITMQGVRGKGLKGWLMLPFKLLNAFSQAHFAIKQHQPNVVLGMGGFAAFPGGVVAWLMRKPLVIHEQNSVAGLTNKVLALFATKTLVAFPDAFKNKKNVTLVGNPVRANITAIEPPEVRFKGRQGVLRLLVVGGSLGAQALNDTIPKALALLPEAERPIVVHQAGEKHLATLQQNYKAANVTADIKAFIADMAAQYAWADIVICRAGALTIAELAAVGVASILVPFPHAVDDHQTTNAYYLSLNLAAIFCQQGALSAETISNVLLELTRERCLEMAIAARSLGMPNSTKQVADICMEFSL